METKKKMIQIKKVIHLKVINKNKMFKLKKIKIEMLIEK